MNTLPDFTSAEHDIVTSTLRQRFSRAVTPEFAGTEFQLDPDTAIMTPCPNLYGQARGLDCATCTVGPARYQAQFSVKEGDAAGSGVDDMCDLAGCVLTLLRLQSDHERRRASRCAPGLMRAAPQARQ